MLPTIIADQNLLNTIRPTNDGGLDGPGSTIIAGGLKNLATRQNSQGGVWFSQDLEGLWFVSVVQSKLPSRSDGHLRLAVLRAPCDYVDMQTVQLEQAQAHLAELIEGVAKGVEVLIARDGRPVAKLVAPSPVSNRRAQFGRFHL